MPPSTLGALQKGLVSVLPHREHGQYKQGSNVCEHLKKQRKGGRPGSTRLRKSTECEDYPTGQRERNGTYQLAFQLYSLRDWFCLTSHRALTELVGIVWCSQTKIKGKELRACYGQHVYKIVTSQKNQGFSTGQD